MFDSINHVYKNKVQKRESFKRLSPYNLLTLQQQWLREKVLNIDIFKGCESMLCIHIETILCAAGDCRIY